MKKALLFLFVIFSFLNLIAQQQSEGHICGYDLINKPLDLSTLNTSRSTMACGAIPDFVVPDNWRSNFTPAELAGPHIIPIQFHVQEVNGTPVVSQTTVDQQIAFANTHFTPGNFLLQPCGPMLTYSTGGPTYNPDVLNIQVDVNGTNSGGTPWDFPSSSIVSVRPNRVNAEATTLSHEIGHVLGLIHTHQFTELAVSNPNWPTQSFQFELVIRTDLPTTDPRPFKFANCAFICANESPYPQPLPVSNYDVAAGDLLCDTPADPKLFRTGVQVVNSDCEYTLDEVDANGDEYEPMVENLMSYAPNKCRTTFTAGQYDRMLYYRLTWRTVYDQANCGIADLNEDVMRIDGAGGATPVANVNVLISHSTDNDCNSDTGNDCTPADPTNALGEFFCTFPTSGFAQADLDKMDTWLNGVTTFDVVLISQHILDIIDLNGWAQIAGDINNSGDLTTFDMLLLRQLILFVITELPEEGNLEAPWRFFPELVADKNPNYFTPNPNDTPFDIPNYPYPDYLGKDWCYEVPDPSEQLMGFHAVKVGDLNGSANTQNLTGQASDRSQSIIALDAPSPIPAGQQITVSFTADQFTDISAFGLGLYIDPEVLEVEAVIPGDLPNYEISDFGTSQLAKGELRTLWLAEQLRGQNLAEDQALFHLNFRTLAPIENLQRHIQLNESILTPEFISSHTALVSNRLSMQVAEIIVDPPTGAGLDLRISPNPFEEELNFHFNAPQREEVQLQIFDVLGRLVFAQTYETEVGAQQLSVKTLGDLPKGALWYNLQGKNWAERGKLLHW